MTTYYLNHTFTTTRCDDCGVTFTAALLERQDCEPTGQICGGCGADMDYEGCDYSEHER